MKTNLPRISTKGFKLRRWSWMPVVFTGLLPFRTDARLPEPPHQLYGFIIISNTPVNSERTDVLIEARRAPAGPAVARYVMGARRDAGDFYVLQLPMEEAEPLASPNSLLPGQTIYLTVLAAGGVVAQAPYTVPGRGGFQRVDLGAASNDQDANGLPDAWELGRFGRIGVDPNADADGDGRSNLSEFIEGTNPTQPDAGFSLAMARVGDLVRVSFVASATAEPGYENKVRRYSLEFTPNLDQRWEPVPEFGSVVGANQTVIYEGPVTDAPAFFRGTVELK